MNVDQERAVLDFVDAGVASHQQGVLPDALDELAIRADFIGAGPMLDQWCRRRLYRGHRRRRWLARRPR